MKRKIIDLTTESKNFVYFNTDNRGSRDKMWFSFYEKPNVRWLFKKTNRDSTGQTKTYEDIGEVVFSQLCKVINVPCVEYVPAVCRTENNDYEGVMSKNYNPNKYVEVSGYSLLDFLKNFVYDNFNGRVFSADNTLDNYEKALICFSSLTNGIKMDIDGIMLQLKKMCILDYLTAQSDRNWYNISFLYDEKSGKFVMTPLFDNGDIFCWNHKESVIKHQYEVLHNKNKISYLNDLLLSKSVALGVHTPTSIIDITNPKRTIKFSLTKDFMETIADEIIDMIVQSKELQEFLFNNFNQENDVLAKAFENTEKKYGEVPQLLKEQSSLMFKLRSQFLCDRVAARIKEQTQLEEDDEIDI